jgi:hypothetical protein
MCFPIIASESADNKLVPSRFRAVADLCRTGETLGVRVNEVVEE